MKLMGLDVCVTVSSDRLATSGDLMRLLKTRILRVMLVLTSEKTIFGVCSNLFDKVK